MASTSTKRRRAGEADYDLLDTGTSMVVSSEHPWGVDSDSGFEEEGPDGQDLTMEEEPPLKRRSMVSSRKPSRSDSEDNNALEEKLSQMKATTSERQPSRIGSLEEALKSTTLGIAPNDTTTYRATYGFGAGEPPMDYFPVGSADSSDSGTDGGNATMAGTMSKMSRLGKEITYVETHHQGQSRFEERELEVGVAERVKAAVLSSM